MDPMDPMDPMDSATSDLVRKCQESKSPFFRPRVPSSQQVQRFFFYQHSLENNRCDSVGVELRMGTLSPVWEESFEFDFDWPRDWRPQKVTEVEAQTRSRSVKRRLG